LKFDLSNRAIFNSLVFVVSRIPTDSFILY